MNVRKDSHSHAVVTHSGDDILGNVGSSRLLPDANKESRGQAEASQKVHAARKQTKAEDIKKAAMDADSDEKEAAAQSRQAMIAALTASPSSKKVVLGRKNISQATESQVSPRSRHAMRAARNRHAKRSISPIRSRSEEEDQKTKDIDRDAAFQKQASDESRQAMINALFASKRAVVDSADESGGPKNSIRRLSSAPTRRAHKNPHRTTSAPTSTTKSHKKEEERKRTSSFMRGSFLEKEKSDQSRQAMVNAFFGSQRKVEVGNGTSTLRMSGGLEMTSRRFEGNVSRAGLLPPSRHQSTVTAGTDTELPADKLSTVALDPPSSSHKSQSPLIKPGAVAVRGIDGSSHLSFEFRSKKALRALSQRNPFGSAIMEIEADLVDEEADREQMAEEIRMEMVRDSVQADVVVTEVWDDEAVEKKRNKKFLRQICRFVALALAIVLGLALGFGLTQGNDKDDSSEELFDAPSVVVDNRPTLEIVRERGYVMCGTNDFAFGNHYDDSGNIVGIYAEQCKAVALVALGDSTRVKQVHVLWKDRFQFLANKTVDLLSEGMTHNMNRDIQEATSMSGLSFSKSWVYSGLSFGGIAAFVDCADELDTFHQECRELKVCVIAGSSHVDVLLGVMRGTNLHLVNSTSELDDALVSGDCNVVAGEPPFLVTLSQVKDPDWKWGSTVLSKEPMSLATRDDDPDWTALVNLVVEGLILAEAHGITRDNAFEIEDLFVGHDGSTLIGIDDELVAQLVALVWEFGNLGDMYLEQVEKTLPRSSNIASGVYLPGQTTGLMYSHPFGDLLVEGPGPTPGGTMDAILHRGYLICGVHPWRGPGFAATRGFTNALPSMSGSDGWSGFDAQFCRGIAAALFSGDIEDRLSFVAMHGALDSYSALDTGTVDIVSGARVSLQAQAKEPTTGRGYKFSTPYYYDTERHNDAFALMTLRNDVQWSDFVNWIVHASIYAEEQGITAPTSADMPVVELFGSSLLQMFRDSIHAMGSLGEVWNATLQDYIPRTGANMLNNGLEGPLIYPVPAV